MNKYLKYIIVGLLILIITSIFQVYFEEQNKPIDHSYITIFNHSLRNYTNKTLNINNVGDTFQWESIVINFNNTIQKSNNNTNISKLVWCRQNNTVVIK